MCKLFHTEFVQSAVGCHNNACSSVINGGTQEAEQIGCIKQFYKHGNLGKNVELRALSLCLLLADLDY